MQAITLRSCKQAINLQLNILSQTKLILLSFDSWFQRKVEVELNELKHNAALRVVLRDLRLVSFDLGSSLPLLDVISVETTPNLSDDEGGDAADSSKGGDSLLQVSD